MTCLRVFAFAALAAIVMATSALAETTCDRRGHHFKHGRGHIRHGHGPRTFVVERPVILPAPRIGLPHPHGLPLPPPPPLPRLPLP